jgi:hypothetical protein
MAWIAELTGYDTTAGALKTLRFAMGAGVALLDSYAPSGLLKWSSPSQKLDVGKDGRVAMSADAGEVTILNAPAAVDQPGPWDALADWSWRNRSARLYWVPALDWSARVLTQQGVLEQPVADLQGRTLTFRLRDPRAALDVPLQPSKYAGSNVGPAGIEGLADLKGRAKPVLYGRVSNITPPRVNESLLIYQVADKAATVDCVRDGGTALTVGTVRASLASMQANDPGPGKYDTYVGAEGAFFRLGSAPQFALTCDVYEGATAADRTHAQIWKRIRKERCGNVDADLDAAAIVAADALDSGEAGFWWFEDASRRDALDQVLGGFSGYELLQLNQTWTMAKLVAPSGSPVIELEQLTLAAKLKTTSRKLTGLTRVRPTYLPDGVPPYRANVNWGRNYTVMAESDFAGAAVQRLRDKFATDWRTETATDLTVWNPATLTGPWPDAPELTIDTGYAVGVDGLTCPAAAAEATRLLALYGGARSGYQAGFVPRAGDMIAPGAVVKLTHPQYGLSGGMLFRVLQSGFVLSGSNEVTAELVLGLGGGGAAVFPSNNAMVHLSANQNGGIVSSYIPSWNVEDYDLSAWHDPATNPSRLTVPAGVSLVKVLASNYETSSRHVLEIIKNGSSFPGKPRRNSGVNTKLEVSVASGYLQVSPGDYFEVKVYDSPTTSITANVATWFAIEAVAPTLKYALVRSTSGQALSAGVATTLAFDAEVADVGGFHDTVSNNTRLTVPAGVSLVRLTGNARDGAPISTEFSLGILKNGALVRGSGVADTNCVDEDNINVSSAVLEVAPGDYFELQATAGSAATVPSDDAVWFAIEEIPASHKRALVYNVTLQTVATGATVAVAFGGEEYDTGNFHDNVTNNTRLTVPAGVTEVRVGFNLVWTGIGNYRQAFVRKNGADFQGRPSAQTTSTGPNNLNAISGWIPVTAGDYFELYTTQASGLSDTLPISDQSWFCIEAR